MHILARTAALLAFPALLFAFAGCAEDGDSGESGGTTDAGETETGSDCVRSDAQLPALDESACVPAEDDYTPTVNGSADDNWPVCTNDDGSYHAFEQPGSAARVEAFEMIRTIFRGDLTPDAFTAARDQYALAEGLESRLVRREDVHYPNIPEAEQDSSVDFDKQCTIEAVVTKYPDRCAGPAKIAPIINDAFAQGQTGVGDPELHAARIDGAIAWFLYLSVIKEATFSCPPADYSGDCDAAWGYYNGASARDAAKGFGADVTAASALSNERVFDGLAAMRCWRDGYPADEDGDTTDPLFIAGRNQLDAANNHAAAVVLRARMEQQLDCGATANANWAWVQTFGQGLLKPAQDIDAGEASVLFAVLDNDTPTPEEITTAVAALDALFGC